MVTNAVSRKLRCKSFATEHIVYRIRQQNSIKIRIFFFNSALLRYDTGTDPSKNRELTVGFFLFKCQSGTVPLFSLAYYAYDM
jgi:hypothetical protein